MARVLLAFSTLIVSLMAFDPTNQQVQVGLGPSDYAKTGAEIYFSEGELEQCELFDDCRTCTFTELQQVNECQKTGFRMILKCTTSLMGSSDKVFETTYHDRPCSEASSATASLESGKYAQFGSGPTRVGRLCLSLVVVCFIVYKILSYRR
jgi:hypothetical protein